MLFNLFCLFFGCFMGFVTLLLFVFGCFLGVFLFVWVLLGFFVFYVGACWFFSVKD